MTLIPSVAMATDGDSAAASYNDIAGHWAEDSIELWSKYSLLEGYDGNFYPNGRLTRGQLATIVSRLLKLKPAKTAGFADVPADAFYTSHIDRCAAAGIMEGYNGYAYPDAPISRQETMVMLARALGIRPKADADLNEFSDCANVADWAKGYVAAMVDTGIVGGYNGVLAPTNEIDRAATVTILDRAISTYAYKDGQTVTADGTGIVLVAVENVTVTGTVENLIVAQGAADSTVTLKDAVVTGEVTVNAAKAEVVLTGKTEVAAITVTEDAAGAAVEVGKSASVETVETAAADSTLTVNGTVDSVIVTDTATGTDVTANKGAAITTVDSAADKVTISGSGTVESAYVTGDNTKVNTDKTDLTVAAGVTGTTENGSKVNGGTTVETDKPTGGSSGGGIYVPPTQPTPTPTPTPTPKYTITFNYGCGAASTNTEYAKDAEIVFPEHTHADYTVVGWYTEAEFTNQVTSATATEDKTYYGKCVDTVINTEQELDAALAGEAATIEIGGSITLTKPLSVTRGVTIVGNGYAIASAGADVSSASACLQLDGNIEVKIENVKFTMTNSFDYGSDAASMPYIIDSYLDGSLTLTGCIFDGDYKTAIAVHDSATTTITRCEFKKDANAANFYGSDIVNATFDSCTFLPRDGRLGSDIVMVDKKELENITLTNCTNPCKVLWFKDNGVDGIGSKVWENGAWVVSVTTATELIAALTDDVDTIKLAADITLNAPITINRNVTLDGQGIYTISNKPITVTANDVTFKNLTLSKPTNDAKKASMVYATDGCKNLAFDGCVFSNPQWEVMQVTSNDLATLAVTSCIFNADAVDSAADKGYGAAANQAVRYIHVEPLNASNFTATICIIGNTFNNCDKVIAPAGIFYLDDGAKVIVGNNTFDDTLTIDTNGKTSQIGIVPNVEDLKVVANWTGNENKTFTIESTSEPTSTTETPTETTANPTPETPIAE